MGRISFIHTADIHLDTPFVGLSKGNKSGIRRDDIKKTFRRIIETVKKRKTDYLFISGDLYESEYITENTINFVNNLFSSIKETKVIMISGNHDPFMDNSFYKNFEWNDNVTVLGNENKKYSDGKCAIYGLGFKNFKDAEYSLDVLPEYEKDKINILLLHGTVDERLSNTTYNLVPVEDIDALHMDYTALGHYHMYFEGMGKNKNIANPGSPEPLGFDEIYPHGIIYGEINKEGMESKLKTEFIKTGEKHYDIIEIDINKYGSDEEIIEYINKTEYKQDKILRFYIKGYYQKEKYIPDISYIESRVSEEFFYIIIKDLTKEEYNLEELSKTEGIKGVYVRKLLDIIKSSDDEDKKKYEDVLYYGLEALDGNIVIKDNEAEYENN
jgi:exonuclease SbcD